MAAKTKHGLYCIKMYLTSSEYSLWKAAQEQSEYTESGYCRVMNLLTPLRVGAPDNNTNGRGRKGKRYPSKKRKKVSAAARPKKVEPLYNVFN